MHSKILQPIRIAASKSTLWSDNPISGQWIGFLFARRFPLRLPKALALVVCNHHAIQPEDAL